ncbi:DUF960 family protein [Enterococcus faecium]
MFQNKGQRHVTKGVMDSLPVELQALCWKLIDQNVQKQLPLDYLQIFEFSMEKEIKSWFIVKKNQKQEKSI